MATENRARPRQYACFTPEQQKFYNSQNWRIRRYIDRRGEGNNRSAAYRLSGYSTKYPAQAAAIFEKGHPEVVELINAIYQHKNVRELAQEDSDINKTIDALAIKDTGEQLQKIVDNGDSETAARLQFYRDIKLGKIKTVRITKKFNGEGICTGKTVEQISDINARIQAQKEIDKILGLNQVVDVGRVQIGGITVNIVDASKQEELEDSRNTIKLDPEDVQVIDGEAVLVEEEKKVVDDVDSASK